MERSAKYQLKMVGVLIGSFKAAQDPGLISLKDRDGEL